jgi:hypothetical protein
MSKPLWWIKLTKYEYWPVWLMFLPGIFIFWPLLAIRARALLYFTAANPGIPLGGFFGEKKYDIIKDIPKQYLPQTLLVEKSKTNHIASIVNENGFSYPLVVKPNIGERGKDVTIVNSESELIESTKNFSEDIMLQEYITHTEEYGVIFYKYPNGGKKGITSIVKKGFLTVIGDGKSTVKQLLRKHERGRLYLDLLEKERPEKLKTIPAQNEEFIVQPIGNHCKGTAFLNFNKLITKEMTDFFEQIANTMDGFYYGRFDLRCSSDIDLQKGTNIKIIEVNGTTSEPGHIYDLSSMNLFKAYRDIWANMKIINTISIINHRQYKVPYSTKKEFLSTLYQHFFKRD